MLADIARYSGYWQSVLVDEGGVEIYAVSRHREIIGRHSQLDAACVRLDVLKELYTCDFGDLSLRIRHKEVSIFKRVFLCRASECAAFAPLAAEFIRSVRSLVL